MTEAFHEDGVMVRARGVTYTPPAVPPDPGRLDEVLAAAAGQIDDARQLAAAGGAEPPAAPAPAPAVT
jgi:hypothetical protein